jgi:hypothetical protein
MGRERGETIFVYNGEELPVESVGGCFWERGQECFFLDCFASFSSFNNFTNARKIPGRSISNRDSLSPNRNRATRPVPVKKCHG